uniref:Retrovirus-related Pol polyprotein from transposon TNT 1-94 n=1 Tax=Sarcoptes scabiei TaxID=52283 RepID=A0A834VHF2_SARSC
MSRYNLRSKVNPESFENMDTANSVEPNALTSVKASTTFVLKGQSNWSAWKRLLVAYLRRSKWIKAIEQELDDDDDINCEVFHRIITTIDFDIINELPESDNSYHIWKYLEKKFESKHKAKIVMRWRELMKKEINPATIEKDLNDLASLWKAINSIKNIMPEPLFVIMVIEKCKGIIPYAEIFEANEEELSISQVFPSLSSSASSVAQYHTGRIPRPIAKSNLNQIKTGHLANNCRANTNPFNDSNKTILKIISRIVPQFLKLEKLRDKVKIDNVYVRTPLGTEKITHYGFVDLKNNDSTLTFKVYYIPGFKSNCLSQSKLRKDGFNLQYSNDTGNWMICAGKTTCRQQISTDSVSSTVMSQRESNRRVSSTEDLAIVRNSLSTIVKISSDICGPLTTSNEDFKYFITFIDEKSLREMAETQTGKKVKSLLTDNAKEYRSANFDKYCIAKGIERVEIPPHSPQQNGIAERKNQSLLSMVRCMLNEKQLPSTFWSYAVREANRILNRIPSKAINMQIPYEIFFNRKPNVKNFRVFGSLAMKHLPSSSKLLPRALPQILVDLEEVWVDEEASEEDHNYAKSAIKFSNLSLTSKTNHYIPNDYADATGSIHRQYWLDAMNDEFQALINHGVFEIVDDQDKKPLTTRWVFSLKLTDDNAIKAFKARIVARGFRQKEGVDYDEIYSPVVDRSIIRLFLALASKKGWGVNHIDFGNAFLNGEIDREMYVKPPEPFYEKGKCWKLKKSLYGLKQSPKIWNQTLSQQLLKFGLMRSSYEPCLYWSDKLMVIVYVDDILIAFEHESELAKLLQFLSNHENQFIVKNLGPVSHFLGINITRQGNVFYLNQESYIKSLADRFEISASSKELCPLPSGILIDETPTEKPIRELIGALNYVAHWTRPDICAAFKIQSTNEDCEIYADADFATDKDGRSSQSGVLIKATSSSEAELIAASKAIKEAAGLRNVLNEINLPIKLPMILTRVDIDRKFNEDKILRGIVKPVYLESSKQLADILTKVGCKNNYKYFISDLCLVKGEVLEV